MAAAGNRDRTVVVPITVAVALLAALNGLPGLNLSGLNVHGSFQYTDVCFLLLITLASWRRLSEVEPVTDPYLRAYGWWGLLLFGVWLFAVREGAAASGSVLHAALFGRDFLYLAVLAPLAPWLIRDEAELRILLITLAAGTAIFTVSLILASLGLIGANVVNPDHTQVQGHITRVWTPMGDTGLIDVVFCGSLGYALMRHGRNARLAAGLAAICFVAMALLLTRALYIGVGIGVLVTLLVWSVSGSSSELVRRRTAFIILVVAIAAIGVGTLDRGFLNAGPTKDISTRVTQGLQEASSNGGTVEIRTSAASTMLTALGGRWIGGLGFRDPSSYYVVGLPGGDIEDNDVGGLDSLVTMGVLGRILVLLPILAAFVIGLQMRRRFSEYQFVYFAAALWSASVILSSPTLGAFDSTPSIVNGCIALGVLARVRSWDLSRDESRRVAAGIGSGAGISRPAVALWNMSRAKTTQSTKPTWSSRPE